MAAVAAVVVVLVGAPARADDIAVARDHYRKAIKAYELGLYDEAIAEFNQAYKAKDDPTILYNLAQAHRMAGHGAEALRTYRMFLLKVPATPNRREVEAHIADLESRKSVVEDPDSERARRYFEAGAQKYSATDYAGAAADFESGRRIKPSPAFDFNIARAYDRLGRTDDALAAYRRYLAHSPRPADAEEIRARIVTLEQRLASEKASAPAPPPTVVTAPIERRGPPVKLVAGIAVGAVGVAALAAGAAMMALAKQTSDELTALDRAGGVFDPDKHALGETLDAAGPALLAIGAAATVAGVVVAIIGVKQRRAARVALAPALGANVGGAVLAGSF